MPVTDPFRRRSVQRLGVLVASGLVWPADPAYAALPRGDAVRAVPTNLTSSNDRMISYRHQEHMWQTADGALHVSLNRGSLGPPGLALYSSFDGGVNWSLQQAFGNTDDKSTADGRLVGDSLALVYASTDGGIVYAVLQYDGALRSWTLVASEVAFLSATLAALNPALDIDESGTVWCGFVSRDRSTNQVNIRMIDRLAGASVWNDPQLVFGPTDRRSIERSARPVRIPGGMGMAYTVRETTFWASRLNGMPEGSAWTIRPVYAGMVDQAWKDPYASHFNLAVDAAGIHLVLEDGYDIHYLRSRDFGASWNPALRLSTTSKSVYSQVGIANGKVAAAFSAHQAKGALRLSGDGGDSFGAPIDLLTVPAAPGVSFGAARVLMPALSSGVLPILQQYTDNAVERLMLFRIPAP